MDEMVRIVVTRCERATSASSTMRRVVTRAIETTRQVPITTLKDILRVATTSEAISMTRRVISRVVATVVDISTMRKDVSWDAATTVAIPMTRKVISKAVLSIAAERNCRAAASSASSNVCLGVEAKGETIWQGKRG